MYPFLWTCFVIGLVSVGTWSTCVVVLRIRARHRKDVQVGWLVLPLWLSCPVGVVFSFAGGLAGLRLGDDVPSTVVWLLGAALLTLFGVAVLRLLRSVRRIF